MAAFLCVPTVPVQVVAAEMTANKRDLLLFCCFPGQQEDPDSFSVLSVLVRRQGLGGATEQDWPNCTQCKRLEWHM